MKTDNKKLNTATIKSSELASLCGLSERRLRQLAADGHLDAPHRGEWQHAATIQKLFTFLRTRTEKEGSPLAQARLEREQARARLAKVAADEAEKKVWPAQAVRFAWTRNVMSYKMKLGAAVDQLSAEAGMRLNLTSEQTATIREIHARLNRQCLVEMSAGDWGALTCKNCHAEIKP